MNGDQQNDNRAFSGAAYVFQRSAGNWAQQAYLKPSVRAPYHGSQFGHDVAIDGDTVVVGAIIDSHNGQGVNPTPQGNLRQSGAVNVFQRNGSNWSLPLYLKASNPDALDHFGTSVAVYGDTVVVGAAFEDSNATGINSNEGNALGRDGAANSNYNAGAVYVFQ